MITLYLDTTSSFLYCALKKESKILFEITKKLERNMSKEGLNLINNKMIENQISFKDINKIIVCNGPGSFTGIRIGVTLAKIIAWSNNIPVTQISSLKAMALSSNVQSEYFIPIINARRGYIYTGIYDKNNKPVLSDCYCTIDYLMEYISQNVNNNYTLISNDAFDFCVESYLPNYKKIFDNLKEYESINAHLLNANYLKRSEAEESYDKKNNADK